MWNGIKQIIHFKSPTYQRIVKIIKNDNAIICHTWYEDGVQAICSGKIEEKFTEQWVEKYQVSYWASEEAYDDAEDYDIAVVQLCADFTEGDLVL